MPTPKTPFIVSHETSAALNLYKEMLIKWNQQINLISPNTIDDIHNRHINDSLQLLEYITDTTVTITDIGSGAGLPGIILAIAGCTNIHLIESDTRKTIFLHECVRRLDLTNAVTIHNKRTETMTSLQSDIVISRACASLAKLLDYAIPHLLPGGYCLFLKGEKITHEIALAEHHNFTYSLFPSVTDKTGCVIKVTNIKGQA